MELKRRDWLVRVNGVEFTELDIEFAVKKSLRPEPNTCSLTVYGLHEDHRRAVEGLNLYDPKKIKGASKTAQLSEVKLQKHIGVGRAPKKGNIRVELEAGYEGTRSLIFQGDLRRGITHYEGPEVKLELEGEDGGRSILSSRINHSFPPGSRQADVVRECASAMGVGLGNIVAIESSLKGTYSHGTAINGQASEILSGLLRRQGISYSVQNGVLAFRRAGEGLVTKGYLLQSGTGLVGHPERDAGGGLMVTTLILPDIAPGAYVQLNSRDFKGAYLVKAVEYRGQSAGNEWYAVLECFPG